MKGKIKTSSNIIVCYHFYKCITILSSATIFTIILCTLPIMLQSNVAPPTLNFTLLLLLLFLLSLSIVCQTVQGAASWMFCLVLTMPAENKLKCPYKTWQIKIK